MQLCRLKDHERAERELLGPPHPGEILREHVLPRLNVSRKALCKDLGVSPTTLSKLLHEKRRVSPELAVGLARISGMGALYWLVQQAHHDAWMIEQPGAPIRPRAAGRSHSKRSRASRKSEAAELAAAPPR